MQRQTDDADDDARERLTVWTMLDHPEDKPDHFVLRRHVIVAGEACPESEMSILSDDLDVLRDMMAVLELERFDPLPEDEPDVMEYYI